jgi:plastocyanin
MSSKLNPHRHHRFDLRQRLLGLGVIGGLVTGVAAVIAMSTAVGGVALLANSASSAPARSPAAAVAPRSATPVAAIAPSASAAKHVMIQGYAYSPAALTVAVGDTVTWTNMDQAPHTVTVTSGPVKFASPTLQKGQSFTYTFTKPGTYQYYCAVHPDMTGTVTVQDKGAAPAPPAEVKPTTPKGASPGMNHGDMPGMGHGDQAAPAAGAPAQAPAAPPAAPEDPVSGAMNPFMAHMQSAHFSRGPGQQVQDIAELDTWLATHQALFRMMLDPEVGPSSTLGSTPMTSVFMQHMDAAHWHRSPMGQANDIANFDSWNKAHLAMFRMMLDPVVGKDSALGKAPGTGVFLAHMDAAHWNKSLNGQATDIVDDAPAWIASHQAMIQMMATSLASGGAGH